MSLFSVWFPRSRRQITCIGRLCSGRRLLGAEQCPTFSCPILFHGSTKLEGSAKWHHIVGPIRQAPLPALALGFAGLIPFGAAPVWALSNPDLLEWMLHAQLAYGACILSFLGGIRWGVALLPTQSSVQGGVSWSALAVSVAPSIFAWLALLTPVPAALCMLSTGLAGCAALDFRHAPYPPWFQALRVCLSAGAITSLLFSLLIFSVSGWLSPRQRQDSITR